MKQDQVKDFVFRYLQAAGCRIIEKQPQQLTVKLSPLADKDLTGRTYYWSFVERTGAEPETMSFTFRFQPQDAAETAAPAVAAQGRIGRETIVFGSKRLQQMFQSSKKRGRFVHLFEQPPERLASRQQPAVYSTWLYVNYKVEYVCDMKRDELHSLGICLSTCEIADNFHNRLAQKNLTPKIPPYTQLKESISLQTALVHLERHVENGLKAGDEAWASAARQRMNDELSRVADYYESLLAQPAEAEQKREIADQYARRKEEIEWQYKPRIQVSAINCGLFHLLKDSFRAL